MSRKLLTSRLDAHETGYFPAGPEIHSPDAEPRSWLHVRRGFHPGSCHRSQHWRVQRSQHAAAAALAISDPAIVGKAIELNGSPVTIVGVLPDSFDFGAVFSPGAKVDLFTPLDLNQERNWGNIVTLFGRLTPGATLAQAVDDANRVAPNLY